MGAETVTPGEEAAPSQLPGVGGVPLPRSSWYWGAAAAPLLSLSPCSAAGAQPGCPGVRQGLCLGLLRCRGSAGPFLAGGRGDRSALPVVIHRSAKPQWFLLLPAAHTMGIRLALGAASGVAIRWLRWSDLP